MRRVTVSATGLLVLGAVALAPAVGSAKEPVYPSKAESLKIAGQMQFRYTFVDAEHGVDDPGSSFNWKRMRLTFAGDLTKSLYYQFRFQGDKLPDEFAFSTSYLGYHLGPVGNVEVGRFDVECTPRTGSSKQPMAERPYHTEKNKAGGQLGIHYNNEWFDERIIADLGVYNGENDGSAGNLNSKFMWAARLSLSPNKNFDYNTGTDLNHSDWGVGFLGGYWTSPNTYNSTKTSYVATVKNPTAANETVTVKAVETTTSINATVNTFGAALYVRGKGLYITGEYTNRTSHGTKNDTTEKYDFKAKGASITAAYAIPMPIKGQFIEPTIRYETWQDSSKREATDGNGNFAWTTIGLNYYLKKYDASFQADYTIKRERGDNQSISNNTFILQGNMYF